MQEFETYCTVKIALRNEIVKCIDEDWIEELKSETMGYNHRSPRKMLDYLYQMGGDLDHMDIAELNQDWRQHPGPTEVLAFAAQEQAPALPQLLASGEPLGLGVGEAGALPEATGVGVTPGATAATVPATS